MTKVIIASVIMASVTIMASITYGKCDLWQVLLMANVIMAKYLWQNIMANETEPPFGVKFPI